MTKNCNLSHVYNSKCHCKQLCNLSSSLLQLYILEPGHLKLHIYCYRCYCSECSPMAISQESLCFQDINNEQVILAQTCKLKLKVMWSKVIKRHKAECFFNSSCPRAQNIKCLCYSPSKNRLHTRKPLYFVTSIVSTGNREGKLEW